MEVQVEMLDNIVVVRPMGVLDASSSKAFKQEATARVGDADRVLVDLAGLQVIDSSGLAALLSLLRLVNGRGGELKICSPTRAVRTVLELVRMHRVVDTLNDREEALRAFRVATAD